MDPHSAEVVRAGLPFVLFAVACYAAAAWLVFRCVDGWREDELDDIGPVDLNEFSRNRAAVRSMEEQELEP